MNKPLITVVIPTRERSEKLMRLINSLKNDSYKHKEVVVVNNSEKKLLKIPPVKVLENHSNKGLAYARTRGAKEAKGEYILFIDDDNVVEKDTINNLVTSLKSHPEFIAVGPLTYYLEDKKRIWFAGVKMNLLTTKPTFIRSISGFPLLHKNYLQTDNLHNCFMIRKTDGDKVGWFDEKIFMSGTEFDLFQKIKKNRQGVLVTDTRAKDYHDMPTFSSSLLRSLGFDTSLRVYYFQRNRGLLVKKYGNLLQQLSLGVLFYPIFLIVYSLLFMYYNKWDFLRQHVKATRDGYSYLLKGE